jgi:MFS family permease
MINKMEREQYASLTQDSFYYTLKSLIQKYRVIIGQKEGGRMDIVLFGGLVGSLFSFLQFISSPVIGMLSDRFGRRAVLLVSMV